jgi:hypothetical protein
MQQWPYYSILVISYNKKYKTNITQQNLHDIVIRGECCQQITHQQMMHSILSILSCGNLWTNAKGFVRLALAGLAQEKGCIIPFKI